MIRDFSRASFRYFYVNSCRSFYQHSNRDCFRDSFEDSFRDAFLHFARDSSRYFSRDLYCNSFRIQNALGFYFGIYLDSAVILEILRWVLSKKCFMTLSGMRFRIHLKFSSTESYLNCSANSVIYPVLFSDFSKNSIFFPRTSFRTYPRRWKQVLCRFIVVLYQVLIYKPYWYCRPILLKW